MMIMNNVFIITMNKRSHLGVNLQRPVFVRFLVFSFAGQPNISTCMKAKVLGSTKCTQADCLAVMYSSFIALSSVQAVERLVSIVHVEKEAF